MISSVPETQTGTTPILDRVHPLPNPAALFTGSQLFTSVVISLLGAILLTLGSSGPPFSMVFGQWIHASFAQVLPDHSIGVRLLAAVCASLLALYGAVLVHETGHVLAGLCVGFRFNSMRVGRIQLDRPFRVSLYRGRGTGASGWASMFPLKKDNLVARAIVMTLAGPAANLATGYSVFLLPFTKGFFWGSYCVTSVCGVLNLVPMRHRSGLSDGKRLLLLLNRTQAQRQQALLKLVADLREGVPPESLSADSLAKATAVCDRSPDTAAAHSIAYAAAFYKHDDPAAARFLETCLEYSGCLPPLARQALMSDAGVFQARRRKRIDLAEQWLEMIPQTTEFPGLRPRVEAAILEGQGDVDSALKKLDEVETLFLGIPNEAQREIDVRFLRRWKSELLAARAGQTVG